MAASLRFRDTFRFLSFFVAGFAFTLVPAAVVRAEDPLGEMLTRGWQSADGSNARNAFARGPTKAGGPVGIKPGGGGAGNSCGDMKCKDNCNGPASGPGNGRQGGHDTGKAIDLTPVDIFEKPPEFPYQQSTIPYVPPMRMGTTTGKDGLPRFELVPVTPGLETDEEKKLIKATENLNRYVNDQNAEARAKYEEQKRAYDERQENAIVEHMWWMGIANGDNRPPKGNENKPTDKTVDDNLARVRAKSAAPPDPFSQFEADNQKRRDEAKAEVDRIKAASGGDMTADYYDRLHKYYGDTAVQLEILKTQQGGTLPPNKQAELDKMWDKFNRSGQAADRLRQSGR